MRTADVLLAHGLDIDAEAFTEDAWKATPLWFAVARGRNLALAEFLLDRGCNPNYALWAAAFNDDFAAIGLLVAHGADHRGSRGAGRDAVPRGGEGQPLRLRRGQLLGHGADVNVQRPARA